jgi:hypothetical protein
MVLNKYQISKPNTREIGEFPLVKLPRRHKEPVQHQSKEATPHIQRSHTASTKLSAETKTNELHRQTNI